MISLHSKRCMIYGEKLSFGRDYSRELKMMLDLDNHLTVGDKHVWACCQSFPSPYLTFFKNKIYSQVAHCNWLVDLRSYTQTLSNPRIFRARTFCFSFKEEKGNTFMTNDLPKVSCAETDHTDQVPCCLVWCLSSVNSLSSYWSFGCCSTMQTHHICFLVALPGFHHPFFFFLLLNTFFPQACYLVVCMCVCVYFPSKVNLTLMFSKCFLIVTMQTSNDANVC